MTNAVHQRILSILRLPEAEASEPGHELAQFLALKTDLSPEMAKEIMRLASAMAPRRSELMDVISSHSPVLGLGPQSTSSAPASIDPAAIYAHRANAMSHQE
jgi:hypothetical protein